MAEYSPSPTGIFSDEEEGASALMKDRIASIYSGRSKSLANLFHFRSAGSKTEVVTPFLDPTNSKISVFIEDAGNEFVICDGGLGLQIVRMANRPDGEAVFQELMEDYGLERIGERLTLRSSEADLLAKQVRLCNALVSLRDRLSSPPRRPPR